MLSGASAPTDIDLLSIDIDSDDLAVWRSLVVRSVKVVVIEFNPTIPFDTDFENPQGKQWGNSAKSLYKLGLEKGYRLVFATGVNLIFVRRDLAESAGLPEFDLQDVPARRRLFWGYDGSLILSDGTKADAPEFIKVPWAGTLMPQPLPRFLRRYWDDGVIRRRLRKAYGHVCSFAIRPFATVISAVNRHRPK